MYFTKNSLRRRILREWYSEDPAPINEKEIDIGDGDDDDDEGEEEEASDEEGVKDEDEYPKPWDIFGAKKQIGIYEKGHYYEGQPEMKSWSSDKIPVRMDQIVGELWAGLKPAEGDYEQAVKLTIGLVLALPIAGKPLRQRYEQRGYDSILDMFRLKKIPGIDDMSKREKKKAKKTAEAAIEAMGSFKEKMDKFLAVAGGGSPMPGFPIFDGANIRTNIHTEKFDEIKNITWTELRSPEMKKMMNRALVDRKLGNKLLNEERVRVTRGDLIRVLREELSRLS